MRRLLEVLLQKWTIRSKENTGEEVPLNYWRNFAE